MHVYDAAIVGAGPAGSACAAAAAARGLDVLLLEREFFPRAKVCGDCLNPAAWTAFDALGVTGDVRGLAHAALRFVRFEDADGRGVDVALPDGEIAVRRSDLDTALLTGATRRGATVRQGESVRTLARAGSAWAIGTNEASYLAERLVAADGRNSTVCRLARIGARHSTKRIAMHAHAPLDIRYRNRVALRLLREGYCGIAPIDGETMNLCLVSSPRDIRAVRRWAEHELSVDPGRTEWHSTAPLERSPVPALHDRLMVIGDAARVVEPFTGEGITWALFSGLLAGEALGDLADRPEHEAAVLKKFRAEHARLYRGRLWIGKMARFLVTRRRLGGAIFRLGRHWPAIPRTLTRRVMRPIAWHGLNGAGSAPYGAE